jgi:hypothetical protein
MAIKKSSNGKAVLITTGSEKKILSKEQKKFNLLIKKIDNKKKLFTEWDNVFKQYRHNIYLEQRKIYDEYDEQLIELLRVLDKAYPNKLFTKTYKNKIKHLIGCVIEELLSEEAEECEEVVALYKKYNPHAQQIEIEEELSDRQISEVMRSMYEEMFDIQFDEDVDITSPEKFHAALEQKLNEKEQQQEEKKRKRKKTAKQLEKEAQLKQQEQEVSKSVQEIYRKMVAALHPDLEQDEAEKVRKTKIMQEVNLAYKAKDLLRLFELQLELEHIDQAQLGNIAEEKLKLFNKTLQNQLKELEQEIYHIEIVAKHELPHFWLGSLSPDEFLKISNQHIESIKKSSVKIQTYVATFSSSPQELKAFLKDYKISQSQSQYMKI